MFLLSISLILISSYIITSSLKEKNNNFIYLLLIVFSQVILSFEILSLFSLISKNNFLICNFITLIFSILIWLKSGKFLYKPILKLEFYKIINAFKRDKLLFIIGIFFIIFLLSTLFVVIYFPITFGDVLKYTFTRCTTWIQNGNLNHFVTPDTRELVMPINMELLYTWHFLFLKNETCTAIYSFIAYLGVIHLLYKILGDLKFCIRRRLWAIFTFSGLALIGIMTQNPCSDIMVGALILSSIYLFFDYCKKDNKKALFFSALAYALAVGVKTTAIMIIPATSIVFLVLLLKYKKENIIKPIFTFILFFTINFIIFSSYNYVLNFIHYAHPISSQEQVIIHKFNGGIKAYFCNLIKYCFIIFDISGINNANLYNSIITNLQAFALSLIGETPDSYMTVFFKSNFKFDSSLTITTTALGALGVFAFLPSFICALKKRKNLLLFLLAITLIINILILSGAMTFSRFNVRYLCAFFTIASPILVFSYIKSNKNIFKWFLCLLLFIYLVKIPTHYPIIFIPNANKIIINKEEIKIYNYLKTNKNSNIALIAEFPTAAPYYIEKLKFENHKIDKLLIENLEVYDLNKYDYIVTEPYATSSSEVLKFDKRADKSAYISPCKYADSNLNEIKDNEDKQPVYADCLIPFEYFETKGFYMVENTELEKYVILKKERNN